MGMKGIVASTAGLSLLLNEGIGDTIRVSSRPSRAATRTEEVARRPAGPPVAGLRSFLPQVSPAPAAAGRPAPSSRRWPATSRPTCATRCPSGARRIRASRRLRVAVMGCVVNGPGESKHADIGISLPGTFEEPVAPVFIDGALDRTLRGDHIVDEFKAILDGSGGTIARNQARSIDGRRSKRAQGGFRHQHHAPVRELPGVVQRRGPEGGAGRLLPGSRLHDHPAVRLRDLGIDAGDELDRYIKATGHSNVYFPLFVPSRCSRRKPSTSRASTRRSPGSPTPAARRSTSGWPSGRPARRSSPTA
jgi:hypothetical protein